MMSLDHKYKQIEFMRPGDVLVAQRKLKNPFRNLFGCVETEVVTEFVVEWLANNGNEWGTQLPLETMKATKIKSGLGSCLGQIWYHAHPYGDDVYIHSFSEEIEINDTLKPEFILILIQRTIKNCNL